MTLGRFADGANRGLTVRVDAVEPQRLVVLAAEQRLKAILDRRVVLSALQLLRRDEVVVFCYLHL